jgi:ribosomal protein S18 acetylase RimI-like enzyme
MGIEVRRITTGEWREYRRLRLEALKDSPLAFIEQYDESLAQPDEFWQHRVRRSATDPASAMFVAVDDGRLVGKVGCFIEPEVSTHVSAHIVGVYVSPAYRGREVAEALMTAAVDWAGREHRSERVRLFVMDTNDRAIAFYRRLGFAPTGQTVPYPPDPSLTEQEMVRRTG